MMSELAYPDAEKCRAGFDMPELEARVVVAFALGFTRGNPPPGG